MKNSSTFKRETRNPCEKSSRDSDEANLNPNLIQQQFNEYLQSLQHSSSFYSFNNQQQQQQTPPPQHSPTSSIKNKYFHLT